MWGKLHASLVYFQLRLYTEHEIWSRPFEAICLFYHTSSWRLPLALPCGVRRKSTRNWEEEKISRFFFVSNVTHCKEKSPPPNSLVFKSGHCKTFLFGRRFHSHTRTRPKQKPSFSGLKFNFTFRKKKYIYIYVYIYIYNEDREE